MLRTEGLTKDYGRMRALDQLTLSVAPGEIFGLLGPNGSGKSTALRMVLGFLRPSAGSARVAGFDCWAQSVQARQHIAYLPGELRLYENMTGQQLVRFANQLHGRIDPSTVERLRQAFEIDLTRPLSQLSSGMKRKVALLHVLAVRAPLLILDEPTNTLDPTMRDSLLALLKQAKQNGQAVLFSSHVLAEVEHVCDRVGILQRGKLVHVQSVQDVQRARRIRIAWAAAPAPLPELPGLLHAERFPERWTLEYEGPLPPLLAWLGAQPVRELTIEPLGLTRIYHQYHGAEAC